jgi:hypothetical protein
MPHQETPDFYKILGVSRNADTAKIREKLEAYRNDMREDLNNPLKAKAAQHELGKTIPAIERSLLAGEEQRAYYDRCLAEAERQSAQQSESAKGLGLDERFDFPFYFDPHNNLDTEQPAHTLRQMAAKLDQAWQQTRSWLAATSSTSHPLVMSIRHWGPDEILARNLEEAIIKKLPQMNIDEAIERCLYLLNPEVERPMLTINTLSVQSAQKQPIYLGDFLPEALGQSSLLLAHSGPRGCLFGRVESLTDWVKLMQYPLTDRRNEENLTPLPASPDAGDSNRTIPNGSSGFALGSGQQQVPFALMPGGKASESTPSALHLPLLFDFASLKHNAIHQAVLLFHVDNYNQPLVIRVQVVLKVLALPPRVSFEPASTSYYPFLAPTTKRGTPVYVNIIARNNGDESMIPLNASLSCSRLGVDIRPQTLRANVPVTLTIETHSMVPGSLYNITIQVDYSAKSGAQGPKEIFIRGEILPTPWGSMLRERRLAQRSLEGLIGGSVGLILGIGAAFFAGAFFVPWLLLLPLVFIGLMRFCAHTILIHRQRAGETPASFEEIPVSVLWLIPIGTGILLALLPRLLAPSLVASAIWITIAILVGYVVSFIGYTKGNKK